MRNYVCLSLGLSLCLSVSPSVYLSLCLSVSLSLSLSLSVCLSVSLCLSLCPSVPLYCCAELCLVYWLLILNNWRHLATHAFSFSLSYFPKSLICFSFISNVFFGPCHAFFICISIKHTPQVNVAYTQHTKTLWLSTRIYGCHCACVCVCVYNIFSWHIN